MGKFKVGDKIKAWEGSDKAYSITRQMDGWTGTVTTDSDCNGYFWATDELGHNFQLEDKYFILCRPAYEPIKIIITTDGKTTTARLMNGKNTVKTATAVCADSDTFDFQTGAKIAFERLTAEKKKPEKPELKIKVGDKVKIRSWESMAKEFGLDAGGDIKTPTYFVMCMKEYCEKIVTVKMILPSTGFFTIKEDKHGYLFSKENVECVVTNEPSEPADTSVKEVHRKAKVGEYVKLLTDGGYCAGTYTVGEVYKVENDIDNCVQLRSDDGDELLNFVPLEYVVLEGYKPENAADDEKKDEKPKYLNGKVVCVKTNCPWWTVGKVYDVVDGIITANDRDTYPHYGREPYKDYEDVRHAGCLDDDIRHNSNNEFIEFKG